jgi:energy-coupling factor transporter ATPase
MIVYSDVSYSYGGHAKAATRPALHAIDLALEDGEMLGVIGANGSGKSTLALLTNGLLLPTSGAVHVDGMDTADPDRAQDVRVSVGVVFQNPDNQIVGTTVEEDVAFGPENLGLPRDEIRRRVDDALSAVELGDLAEREPHLLSGGQKQRLAIAGAVAMRPRHLVLDEPSSMLDAEGRRDVAEAVERLRAAGTSIVHITHDLANLLGADRVAVLDRGALVFCGTVSELIADHELLRDAGIGVPPIVRFAQELRAAGLPMDGYVGDAASVAGALWR